MCFFKFYFDNFGINQRNFLGFFHGFFSNVQNNFQSLHYNPEFSAPECQNVVDECFGPSGPRYGFVPRWPRWYCNHMKLNVFCEFVIKDWQHFFAEIKSLTSGRRATSASSEDKIMDRHGHAHCIWHKISLMFEKKNHCKKMLHFFGADLMD